ncbi:MAG TPA: M20 family metallopeptidase [Pyrinomonadaceae bacterium]|jgi:glutamate carboxypeptidase
MNAKELLEYFSARQNEVLNLIRRLVEIESPSYDEVGSRAVVELLVAETGKLPCVDSIEKIPVEGYGEHLIIRAFSRENEKPALLLGHIDTVYPRGTLRERPWREEDGKIFAPGIFDMKSGAALMIETLRAFSDLNLKPSHPITILLSCDEEVGSETGRAVVEREAEKAAFCLVCEPSANGAVKTGRKGTGYYLLKAHGVASHAGLDPEKGASAILELARQTLKIHELNNPENGTTTNVTTITGGTTSNVIPAAAECEIDVRFTSLAEAERIEREIKNLKPFDSRVRLEIEGAINRPPMERTEKTVRLFEKAREIAASFDYKLKETQVGGASDGNFVSALGVPVLDGLGVAGDGAHAVHEHIMAADVPKRAALIAALLLKNL